MKITLMTGWRVEGIYPCRQQGRYTVPTEGQWAGIPFRENGKLVHSIPGGPHAVPYQPEHDALLADQTAVARCRQRIAAALANVDWRTITPAAADLLARTMEAAASPSPAIAITACVAAQQ